MGKASRTKRKRASVRSAKRARNNNWWYALTALVVIAGVSLIVYAHATAPTPVGPFVADQVNASNPHNKDSHWHAALGVYDCDHWVGDNTGEGLWVWPIATPGGQPGRANNTNVYAGLHSHGDGIIHMEPATNEDAGRHATVGRYFDYGGWKVSETGYDFLGAKVKNGDQCTGGAGTLVSGVGRWDGTDPPGPQKIVQKSGNPADWKLHQGDIVVIAFVPPGKTLASLGNPPSVAKLPGALGAEDVAPNSSSATTMPPIAPTTTPTPTTAAKPVSPTTKP